MKLNKLLSTSSSSAKGSIVNGSIISDQLKPNGLCDPCNRNQELKVQQLASFCPDNENDFDDEVEEFRLVFGLVEISSNQIVYKMWKLLIFQSETRVIISPVSTLRTTFKTHFNSCQTQRSWFQTGTDWIKWSASA